MSCVVACRDRRRPSTRVVLEDDAVVADLDQVAVLEVLRVRDAEAVDEDAVVAGEVFEDERRSGRRAARAVRACGACSRETFRSVSRIVFPSWRPIV